MAHDFKEKKEHHSIASLPLSAHTVSVGGDHVGIYGKSTGNTGVYGESQSDNGVFGITSGGPDAAGVSGQSDNGRGVAGFSKTWQGVYGASDSQAGVVGESKSFDGVSGISHSNQHSGVFGHNTAGGMAAFFEGNVVVTGGVQIAGTNILAVVAVVNFITRAGISIAVGDGYVIRGTHFTPGGEVDVSLGNQASPAGFQSFTVPSDGNGNFTLVSEHVTGATKVRPTIFEAKDVATGLSIKGSLEQLSTRSSWSWRSSES